MYYNCNQIQVKIFHVSEIGSLLVYDGLDSFFIKRQCQNLYKKDGELFLVPVDCDPEIAEQSKLIALSSIKQKNHLIAVLNALIKAVDGLHSWEDFMFGEDE